MAKKETPHLNKWKNSFLGKTGKLRDAALQSIGEVMPNTTQTVQSASFMARETRQYVTKTRSFINSQVRKMKRTSGDIMDDAFHDIQTGNYSLERFSDSIYDTSDNIDEMVKDIDETTPGGGGTHQSAIIGKAVVEGNAATIQGLQQMTNTVSSVTLKSTEATIATIKDMGLFKMNQTNTILQRMSQQIKSLDSHLDALVRFNNETSLQVNNAALEFYQEADNKLYAMGEVLSEMKDFMDQTKQTSKPKKDEMDPYDFRNGFDFGNYKDMVKKNFGNSFYGTMLSMGKMMIGMGGSDPATNIMSMLMSAALPGQLKKSLKRTDKMLTAGINDLLYRIGDMQYEGTGLKSFVGEVFGKKRPKFSKANLGDYKKDYMGWNGVAQRYLTEVIPSYLANIESALTKKDTRYYNADTGMFMSTSQIENNFQRDLQSTIEWNMMDFVTKVTDKMNTENLSEDLQQQIKSTLSNIVSDQVLGKSGVSAKENIHNVRSTLENSANITGNDLRDIMVEFTDGLHKTQESVNEFVHAMEDDISSSVYRNLHNTKGSDTSRLYKNADIFAGSNFTIDGLLFDDLSDSDKEIARKKKANTDKQKEMENKGGLFGFLKRNKKKSRASRFVDNRTDDLYDILTGEYQRKKNRGKASAATSQASAKPMTLSSSDRRLNEAIDSALPQSYDRAMERSTTQLLAQSRNVDRVMQDMAKEDGSSAKLSPVPYGSDRATSQADAGIANITNSTLNAQRENTNILKRLVLSIHSNFLQPLVGGLFGKDGFFRRIFDKENMKKMKEKLFNEKDGVFGGISSYAKDQFDYLKYVFTGKQYTNRKGETFPENENSVLDHLAGGWDFLYRNTMKYLFGEGYESNETFKKYFAWMDWKGKRAKKRKERLAKENAETQEESIMAHGTNAEEPSRSEARKIEEVEKNQQLLLEDSRDQKFQLEQERTAKLALPELPGPVESPGKFELLTPEDTQQIRSEISTNMIVASQDAAALIVQSGENLSTALVGDFSDEEKSKKMGERANQSFMERFKKGLPRSLAFGAIGAGVGTYTMFHGAGLLGSLFLPGGPISGALLGIGLSLATKSDKFMNFLFGDKDDDGKRTGGLISKKTQEWTKKAMPLMVGGAMVGAAKSLFLGGLGSGLANGPGGFLLQALLPGGMIGGAMLGLGISLFKNNEKVKEILWGKDDGSGKKIGGILNKESSKLGKIFAKSGNFIKGGLKGLGVGLITNATLGGAGVLGAAVTAGGPIGLGLTGLGIGIASQTKKFQEVLFGTEEYDENGKFIGRRQDGLLTRARNMLQINVFEPIKDKIQDKAVEFAYWAKEAIEYPFRLAFGPIIDSFKGIKQNIEDSLHEMFHNVGETITDFIKAGFKKLFSPFTKLLKFTGNLAANGLKLGLQAALMPISAPLKMLQSATAGKRFRENQERRQTQLEYFGDIISNVRDNWANEDAKEKGYTGVFGGVKRFVGHAKDIKQGWDASTAAYNNEMAEQGFNSLNWRNVKQEKRDLKRSKREWKDERKNDRRAWKFRQSILKDHKYDGDTEFTEDAIKDIQKKGAKLGFSKESLATSEDINQFLLHKSDWLDKWNPNNDKTSAEYQARHGMLMRESPEMAKARHDTKSYQEAVLEKFSGIEKAFTIYAAQNALNKRSNLNQSEIESITKDLRSKGLSWDDVGFDPADLADVGGISNEDWDELLKGMYEDGDIQSYREWYRKKFVDTVPEADIVGPDDESFDHFKGQSTRYEPESSSEASFDPNMANTQTVSVDEDGNIIVENNSEELAQAIIVQSEILGDIRDATQATASLTEEELNATSVKEKNAAIEAKRKAHKDTESEESKRSRGLSLLSLPAESAKEKEERAKLGNEDDEDNDEEESEETKKSGIGGFLKGIGGNLTSWLLSSSVWTKLGIGTILMGLFGEQIIAIGSAITGFIKEHIWPHASKLLGTIWNGLQKYVPILLNKARDFIFTYMPDIINNAVQLGWHAVETMGKMAINGLASLIPGVPEPFPDAHVGKKVEGSKTTYNTKEIAESSGVNLDGSNVTVNPDGTVSTISAGYGYDEDGNPVDLRSAGKGFGPRKMVHYGYKLGTSKLTRKLTKGGAKLALKTAGWVTGIIPGGKIIKAVGKGGYYAGKGAVAGGKAIKRGLSKAGSKAAEEATEAGIKQGSKEVVEEATEATIKKGSQEVAEQATKGAAKDTGKAILKNAENTTVDIIGANGEVLSTVEKKSTKAAEDAGAKLMQEGVEKATKQGSKEVVENTAKKGIKGFLERMKKRFAKIASTVKKWLPEGKFLKTVNEGLNNLIRKMSSADSKLISKVGDWLAKKLGYTGAKAAIGVVPILNAFYTGFSAIVGAVKAGELFGVEHPTAGMRAVSALMEAVLSTSIGVFVDLVFTLATFFGVNWKQSLARKLYSIIDPSSAENLEKQDAALEVEAMKYNKANNTKLTKDQWLELKTRSKYDDWWDVRKFFSSETKMSEKEKKKYAASEEEIEEYMKTGRLDSSAGGTSKKDEPTKKDLSEYQGQDLLYGSKYAKRFSNKYYTKALSYGDAYGGALTQSDPRWGSFELGKFSDGTMSTMTTGGCGPTALSMVANSFGGHKSPLDVAQYAKNNGYIQDGGSTSGLFTTGANAMGLSASKVGKTDVQTQLQSGSPMIIAGKSKSSASPYTDAGHVVVANGVDQSGNAIVNNPMDQNVQHVPVNELTNGMTHAWSYSTGNDTGTSYGRGVIGYGNTMPRLTNSMSMIKKDPVKVQIGQDPVKVKESIKVIGDANKKVKAAALEITTTESKAFQKGHKKYITDSKSFITKDQLGMTPEVLNELLQSVNLEDLKFNTGSGKLEVSNERMTQALEDEIYKKIKNSEEIGNPNISRSQALYLWKKYHAWSKSKEAEYDKAYSGTSGRFSSGSGYAQMSQAMNYASGFDKKRNSDGVDYDSDNLSLEAKEFLSKLAWKEEDLAKNAWGKWRESEGTNKSSKYIGALYADDAAKKAYTKLAKEKYKEGSANKSKWNKSDFYNGMFVGTLRVLAKKHPELIDDGSIPLFRQLYYYYIKNNKHPDTEKITTETSYDILNASSLKDALGGDGETVVGNQKYQYRNGFPFFWTEDERWNDLEWRGDRIGTRGSDISSVAAITSAYGDYINDPRMIYSGWLPKFKKWGNVNKGIDEQVIFSDGGLNALESTHGHVVDADEGKEVQGRLHIERLRNQKSIVNALTNRIPVYLSGYRYPGSIFGGTHELNLKKGKVTLTDKQIEAAVQKDPQHANEIIEQMRASQLENPAVSNTKELAKKDSYGSVVAIGANSTHMAINNPYDKLGTPDIFDVNDLSKTLKDGTDVVKSAWAIKGPNGKGLNSKVDLSAKASSVSSDHKALADQKGITDKLTALFSNLAHVFEHQASALIEGKKYKSIWELNDTEVTEDSTGVGKTGAENQEASLGNEESDGNDKKDDSGNKDTGEAGGTNPYETKDQENGNNQSIGEAHNNYSGSDFHNYGSFKGIGPLGSGLRDIPIAFGKTKKSGSMFSYDPQHAVEAEQNEKYAKKEKKVVAKERKKQKAEQKASTQMIGKKGSLLDNLTLSLNAVGYATQASAAGTDYETAKAEYIAAEQKKQSGDSGSQEYPSVNTKNVDLGNLTEEGIKTIDILKIPKPSPSQIRTALVKNFQRNGSIFKKGQEENDANGIYQAQEKTGLSSIIPFAIGAHESGWGTSHLANEKGNMWGWKATNKNTYKNAQSFSIDDKGASFEGYSNKLLKTYYKGYDLKTIAEMGSGKGNGNIAYAQDGHGNASTTWAKNVGQTGYRIVKSMREAKEETVTGPGSAGWYIKSSRAIGFGGNWLNIVQQVKSQLANGKGYSQSAYTEVTIDGKTIRVRRDCSGFVSGCCNFYGAKIGMQTSGWFADRNHNVLEKAGFQSAPWPGWDKLKAGDIIARGGHVEIFAGNKGGRHYVYNVGSDKSANSPDATPSAKSSYTTIWRPAEAGSVADLFSNSLGAAARGMEDQNQSSGGSSGGVELTSPLDVPLASLGNTFGTVFDGKNIINNTFSSVKGPGSHPVAKSLGGNITSVYGSRKTSLGSEFHRGIDIAATRGTGIKSPVSGQVVSSGTDVAGYGNYTMIRDQKGYNHLFAHMDKPGIYGVGSTVNSNDVIGEVGMTGKTTGDHLHYEIRKSGNKYSTIDPFSYDYDNTGKDLNLLSQMNRESMPAVGSGDRDIPVTNPTPTNIDLNAEGVENRLDSLIDIMTNMARRETPSSGSNTISQTTNTTNVYGSGRRRVETKKKTKSSGARKNQMADALMKIHKEIALK